MEQSLHRTEIGRRTGRPVGALHPIGGGSINATWRVEIGSGSVFCKQNSAPKFPQLLGCESAGLKLIAAQQLIRTPRVIDQWENGRDQYLLLEWIGAGEPDGAFWERFGRALAALHRCTGPAFGGVPHNYMGSVPQSNRDHSEWPRFFGEERLAPLVRRCRDAGLLDAATAAAIGGLGPLLEQVFDEAPPCLVHGDLWSGNFLCAAGGTPVLIDPAAYWGHRSVDLAMTTLFGGFEPRFYEAYHEAYPLPPGHRDQWALCNLYPLLVHLLLFGRSYLAPVKNTLGRFA